MKKQIKIKIPKGLNYGKIIGFSGSWDSGIGYLNITDEKGFVITIFCENGQTVRALDACYGNVISDNHIAESNSIKGKKIFYAVDDLGILFSFIPVEDYFNQIIK